MTKFIKAISIIGSKGIVLIVCIYYMNKKQIAIIVGSATILLPIIGATILALCALIRHVLDKYGFPTVVSNSTRALMKTKSKEQIISEISSLPISTTIKAKCIQLVHLA